MSHAITHVPILASRKGRPSAITFGPRSHTMAIRVKSPPAASQKGMGKRSTRSSRNRLRTISGTFTAASASSSALRTRRGFSSSQLR